MHRIHEQRRRQFRNINGRTFISIQSRPSEGRVENDKRDTFQKVFIFPGMIADHIKQSYSGLLPSLGVTSKFTQVRPYFVF